MHNETKELIENYGLLDFIEMNVSSGVTQVLTRVQKGLKVTQKTSRPVLLKAIACGEQVMLIKPHRMKKLNRLLFINARDGSFKEAVIQHA